MNLKTVRKIDGHVSALLQTVPQVAVYRYIEQADNWVSVDESVCLFVCLHKKRKLTLRVHVYTHMYIAKVCRVVAVSTVCVYLMRSMLTCGSVHVHVHLLCENFTVLFMVFCT